MLNNWNCYSISIALQMTKNGIDYKKSLAIYDQS